MTTPTPCSNLEVVPLWNWEAGVNPARPRHCNRRRTPLGRPLPRKVGRSRQVGRPGSQDTTTPVACVPSGEGQSSMLAHWPVLSEGRAFFVGGWDRMAKRLLLVRHGRVAANQAGRFIGATDLPLDDLGRSQCRGLGGPCGKPRAQRCYSSPMRRPRRRPGVGRRSGDRRGPRTARDRLRPLGGSQLRTSPRRRPGPGRALGDVRPGFRLSRRRRAGGVSLPGAGPRPTGWSTSRPRRFWSSPTAA